MEEKKYTLIVYDLFPFVFIHHFNAFSEKLQREES